MLHKCVLGETDFSPKFENAPCRLLPSVIPKVGVLHFRDTACKDACGLCTQVSGSLLLNLTILSASMMFWSLVLILLLRSVLASASGSNVILREQPEGRSRGSDTPSRRALVKRVDPSWVQSELQRPEQPASQIFGLRSSASLPKELKGSVRDSLLFAADAHREYKKQLGLHNRRAASPTSNLRGLQVHSPDLAALFQLQRPTLHPQQRLQSLHAEQQHLQHEARATGGHGGPVVKHLERVLRTRRNQWQPAEQGHSEAQGHLRQLLGQMHHVPPHLQLWHGLELERATAALNHWNAITRAQSHLGERVLQPALRQKRLSQVGSEISELEQQAARRERSRGQGPSQSSGSTPTSTASSGPTNTLPRVRGPRTRIVRTISSQSLSSIPEDSE